MAFARASPQAQPPGTQPVASGFGQTQTDAGGLVVEVRIVQLVRPRRSCRPPGRPAARQAPEGFPQALPNAPQRRIQRCTAVRTFASTCSADREVWWFLGHSCFCSIISTASC